MAKTFASMKFYNYRLWFFTALIANVGTWMQRVAQDWLVLAVLTDDDGFAVGVTTALQFLPLLLVTPYAGVLADRLDKRKIMYVTQAASAILGIAQGVLVLTGTATVWHIYVFALLLGFSSAFDAPPRQVFVSELVPKDNLPNAVGLNSLSFNIARLIGPALSGVLIGIIGTGWVFIINGVSFVVTIIGLALMRKGEFYPAEHAPRHVKGQIRQAISYVKHRDDIIMIFILAGTVACLGMNFQLTTATMAREVFNKDAGEYGILGSVLAIGSLFGALLAARRTRPRVRLVVASTFAFAIVAGLNAVMPTYWTYAFSLIPVGFVMLTLLTAANATIQMSTAPEMRGRVMALYQMIVMGSTPVGSTLVGWISENIDPRWAIGVGPISAFIVGVCVLIWARRNWHVEVHFGRRLPHGFEIVGPAELLERDRVAQDRVPGDQAK